MQDHLLEELQRLKQDNTALQAKVSSLEQSRQNRRKYNTAATPQAMKNNKSRSGRKTIKFDRVSIGDPSDTTVPSTAADSATGDSTRKRRGPTDSNVRYAVHKLAHLAMIKAGAFPTHILGPHPGVQRTLSVHDVVTAAMDKLKSLGLPADVNGKIFFYI